MRETFKIELKNDKLTYSQWFIFFIAGIIGGFIGSQIGTDKEVQLALISIFSIVGIYGLFISQRKTLIVFQGNNLVIQHNTLGVNKAKYYRIDHIENITFLKNVNSGISTSSGHVRIMGIDATPESWKEYYYHKEVINFEYGGKKVVIGKWKKAFGGKTLVRKIKEYKQEQ